jgi:colanic acid biosynthesis glycosyl transferase WcaI
MRVLILGLNYAPELIGVGRYTADFALWLAERGHQVRVITAPPYYPEWQVRRGYAAWRYGRERVDGIDVLRCPTWVPARPSPLKRILHLLSFALTSWVPALWQALSWRPEVVWTVEPTAFAAPGALLAARLSGARACLHVQDLEIEAACTLRLLACGRLQRPLQAAYGWLLRRFDLVSTIAEPMRRQLRLHRVAPERLCLFPNWVDTDAIRPLAGASALRRALGFSDSHLIVLYSGNMGEKQDLEGLAAVAARLADRPEIRFVLCGAGALRERLQRLVAGRPNVVLLPLQPRHRLNELLNLADIHILPQRAAAINFALPSKLGGILASGRPVVAQAEDGELARAAEAGGIRVAPGDPASMAGAVLALAADAEHRRELGRAARRFAETHLERGSILARYERTLIRAARARPAVRARWPRLREALAARLAGPTALPYPTPWGAPGRRR